MKVALTCMNIEWENKPVNRDKCVELIKRASLCGARLILFPEMTLTGFTMNVATCGEEEPYESVKFFCDLSTKYEVAIGFGVIIKKNKKGENHFLLVDQGKVVADYAKIHPFSYSGEDQFYEAGTKLVSCSLESVNIGMFICYDLRFPEIFMESSRKNEVLAIIANWPQRRVKQWKALLKARAIENQSVILGVNRIGEGDGLCYDRSSYVFDSYGEEVPSIEEFSIGEDSMMLYDLNVNEVLKNREEFPVRKDRNVSLYQKFYKE